MPWACASRVIASSALIWAPSGSVIVVIGCEGSSPEEPSPTVVELTELQAEKSRTAAANTVRGAVQIRDIGVS